MFASFLGRNRSSSSSDEGVRGGGNNASEHYYITDENILQDFRKIYGDGEMIETGARDYFQKYWHDTKWSDEERTRHMIGFFRDVVFEIPKHQEQELQLPTRQNMGRTQLEQLLSGGTAPDLQTLMQFLRGFTPETTSDAKVPTDEAVMKGIEWFEVFLYFGNPKKQNFYRKMVTTNRGVCGKTWTVGDLAFKCRTCQKDPTCAICEECFKKGNHEGHDYTMTRTSNGMCDCGDAEAWSEAGFCCDHTGRSDPLAHLDHNYKQLLEVLMMSIFGNDGVIMMYIRKIVEKFNSIEDEKERQKSLQLQTLYQNFVYMLESIAEKINSSPCLKNLAYHELRKLGNKENITIVDEQLQSMPKMSQSAKTKFYELYSALITDAEFKLFFSECFLRNYSLIISDYIAFTKKKKEANSYFAEDEDEDVSKDVHVSSISVQLFTTPTIATHLVDKCNLVSILLDSLIEAIEEEAQMDDSRNNKLVYKPVTTTHKIDAVYHVIFDISYCVIHKRFCEELLLNEECLHKFLTFLSYIQAASDIKRLDTDESQWFTIFNLEMITLPKIARKVTNVIETFSENTNYIGLLKQIVRSLAKFIKDDNVEIDNDGTVKNEKPFNIPITYHLPIQRFATTVFIQLMTRYPTLEIRDTISNILKETTPSDVDITNKFLLQVVEHPLKEFVTGAQINARLWQRNHEHILDQHFNFASEKFADYAYCNDFFLVQLIFGLIDNNELIYKTLLKKFNNTLGHIKLYTMSKPTEDEDRRAVLEEEFVRLLLTIYSNRVNMESMTNWDICRQYVLHYLFSEQKCKFSDIVNSIPKSFRSDVDVKAFVNEVANFHKPKGSHEQGYFTVKSNQWDEFNPYFISMSSQKYYQAIENYKAQHGGKSSPPLFLEKPTHAANTQIEHGLMNLIVSSYLYKIIFLVMYRSVKTSASEQLPPYILHALLASLNSLDTRNYKLTRPPQKTLFSPISNALDIPFKENESPINYVLQSIEMEDGSRYSIIELLFKVSGQPELVEKILNRLSELNETCDQIILEAKSVTESSRHKEEKDRKKQKALESRQKLLEKMKASQQKFALSLDEDEEVVESVDKLKCAFCHDHQSPEGNTSLSLMCQIVKNPFPHIVYSNDNQKVFPNIENKIVVDIGDLTEMFSDVNKEHNVQINYCSHACHADCYDRYYSNLLQEESRRRRYKGFGQINLESMEILCPVCNRVINCLCPLASSTHTHVDNTNSTYSYSLPDLDDIKSIFTNLSIKNAVEDVKTNTTFSTFSEKIIRKKKEDLGDTLDPMEISIENFERTDSSYFCNALISELVVEEILQRSSSLSVVSPLSESSRKSISHLFDLLISYQQLSEDNKKTSSLQLKALYASLMGLTEFENLKLYNEQKRSGKMYLPLLSSDMFSLLVRLTTLLFSSQVALKKSQYHEILGLLYQALVIQIIIQFNIRLGVSVSTGVESLDEDITSIANIPIVSSFQRKVVDLTEQEMEAFSLAFLRRAALYHSFLFPDEVLPIGNDYSQLRSYLKLPSISELLMAIKNSPAHNDLIAKWIEQVTLSMQSISAIVLETENFEEDEESLYVLQADSLLPFFGKCHPFSFIELPRLYEDIFLQYHNEACPECGKKLENPTLCLITGKIAWLKNCSCSKDEPLGKCTRHAREHFSGFGLFLMVPSSRLLLLHEGRSSILPSPYLDSMGEEDKNLRRGVPLFFHKERLEEFIPKLARMNWDHDTIILEKSTVLNSHTV
ncbi:hypothetical protein C9374_011276 [Naegleria lovaniensis]|uniref:E3 ubiquitin-protein ligase n=1 Tax=Naegleria lovaniensis TaxID=51637 RepID=A0AA88H1X4_NAELO|nr:uncharacterized protein C9374_011276 [Naegleria lovaniensis]KAG2392551.1 hypothetical protein C9374_011276 [Naegleria lovaniensis]